MTLTGSPHFSAVRLAIRIVKGLVNAHAATILAARAERPILSIDDLWRREDVQTYPDLHIDAIKVKTPDFP